MPKIGDNYEQVITPQTAYQLTSILEGVVERGTAKKLKKLILNIAGKLAQQIKIQMHGL